MYPAVHSRARRPTFVRARHDLANARWAPPKPPETRTPEQLQLRRYAKTNFSLGVTPTSDDERRVVVSPQSPFCPVLTTQSPPPPPSKPQAAPSTTHWASPSPIGSPQGTDTCTDTFPAVFQLSRPRKIAQKTRCLFSRSRASTRWSLYIVLHVGPDPIPTPSPPRYEEIRVTFPAARTRQLSALEAYKVRPSVRSIQSISKSNTPAFQTETESLTS